MFKEDKLKLKNSYIEFMNNLDVVRMITVTFKYKFSDKVCLDKLNHALYNCNRMLYRNSFTKHKINYMKGVVVLERHKSGAPHFHILVVNDTNLKRTDEVINAITHKAFAKVWHTGIGGKKYRPFSDEGIDVRAAETDSGNLSRYLTKEGYDYEYNNIGLLGKDNVTFDFI